jgi:N6-adenosine-specific RNA methylase IME4
VLYLDDREAAADWIDANQLGRRNLTPDQASLLRGRRYSRMKRQGARNDLTSGHFVQKSTTAETLATQHGVDERTIRRDGQYAVAVEKLKQTEPEIERWLITGRGPAKSAVIKAAQLLESAPEKAQAILRGEAKMSDVIRDLRREEYREKLESVSRVRVQAAAGLYDVIVIDPPWPMQKIERDVRPNQSEFDYPTMTEEELAALSIPTAEDCHVWLWTTHRFLPMALRLLDTWQLRYVCTFVWHKPGGFQPMGMPQYNCEFALYARRGNPQFLDTQAFSTCFTAGRGRHSEKPEAFYEMVRRVTAGRRLDMFSRRIVEGFGSWGNEAL